MAQWINYLNTFNPSLQHPGTLRLAQDAKARVNNIDLGGLEFF